MRGPVITSAQTLLAIAARTRTIVSAPPAFPTSKRAAVATGVDEAARPARDSTRIKTTLSATYSTVTTNVPSIRARGMLFWGSRNSPATYAAAFHPLYVKKIGTSAESAVALTAETGGAKSGRAHV